MSNTKIHPDFKKISEIEIAGHKFILGYNHTLSLDENLVQSFGISCISQNDNNGKIVSSVISLFEHSDYVILLSSILNKRSLSFNDIYIEYDENKDNWTFSISTGDVDFDPEPAKLSYIEGISLFHGYFSSFQKYLNELKNSKKSYKDFSAEWYEEFNNKMDQLNDLYKPN